MSADSMVAGSSVKDAGYVGVSILGYPNFGKLPCLVLELQCPFSSTESMIAHVTTIEA